MQHDNGVALLECKVSDAMHQAGMYLKLFRSRVEFNKKLDGVGPVVNRPSTAKLYHFVRKKTQKNMTCDM